MSLEKRYLALLAKPTNIQAHLPKLRELAGQCRNVTEFGVRRGNSTTALLAGQPETLVCYDIQRCAVIEQLQKVCGRCRLTFIQADTRQVRIDPTDLLFIDTIHTARQVALELENSSLVRRWIAIHDTGIFGKTGQDGGPGLTPAIEEFLAVNPQWVQIYYSCESNGLTVLERVKKGESIVMREQQLIQVPCTYRLCRNHIQICHRKKDPSSGKVFNN